VLVSSSECRLLRLALNRLGEKGNWDLDELKLELEELVVDDAAIEVAGFELSGLDQILLGEGTAVAEQGPLEPQDDALAVSRLGDLFHLEEHRILCGDATNPASFARLIGGNEVRSARLILADPPFNVPIVGNVTKGKHP
jgi:hypothetical protein